MNVPIPHARPRGSQQRVIALVAGLIFATAGNLAIRAQTAASDDVSNDAPVVLSPFEVTGQQTSRYQADEIASGGRVAAGILDTPGSISVVTSELLDDVGAERLADALKYASGVVESITPNGLERVVIRGFRSDFTIIDGFRTNQGQMNIYPAYVQRLEVMKGPDAILQPQGTPGGTVNTITKSPDFRTRGELKVQAGLFDTNQAMIDYNTVAIPGKVATRIVAGFQDSEGWWDASFKQMWMVAPSVLWQINSKTRLVVKSFFGDYRVQAYGGIPVDPSVGTNDELITFRGVERDSNPRGAGELRSDVRQEVSAFLTTSINDNISVRFAGRFMNLNTYALGTNINIGAGNGRVDPATGNYIGSTIPVSPIGLSSAGDADANYHFVNFQNDYVFKYDFENVRSTTTAGFAYAGSLTGNSTVRTASRGQVDVTKTEEFQNVPITFSAITQHQAGQTYERQVYLREQLGLLDDRLLLTGGISSVWASRESRNKLTGGVSGIPTKNHDSFSYGAVYKITPDIAVYYGHSTNASLTTDTSGVSAGTAPLFSEGVQDEIGVKLSTADKRVSLTVAYYELEQTQFNLGNPGNFTSPPPVPRLPALYGNIKNRGTEASLGLALTNNWTVVGSVFIQKARQDNGVPLLASSDRAAGLFTRYDFKDGALKGFGFGVGVDYLGKRPGIQASNYTNQQVPIQPSFYLPERTLVNASLYYTRGQYSVQATINNVLNEEYYQSAFNRSGVFIGTPTNLRVSVSYRF